MVIINVKYNHYSLKTELKIDGKDIKKDSDLYNTVATGNRLQEWVEDFPQLFVKELKTNFFDIYFHGIKIDFDDFKEVFEQARKNGIINKYSALYFIKSKDDKNINVFRDSKIMENFSEKRFNHMKEVAKAIYTDKIKWLNKNNLNDINNSILQITVKYNPYRLKTELKIDGKDIKKDSNLYNIVATENRLQEWVEDFPQLLVDELNSDIFDINFYGTQIDFDDFKEAFEQAKKDRVINKGSEIHFINDNNIKKKIIKAFKDLQDGPIEDFRDPKLIKAFEDINNSVFPVNVIATMSAGKSTLINALLQKELMPSKNEACTAIITEILNSNNEQFNAVVYDKNGNKLESISNLTYEKMDELNSNSNVSKIEAEGKIPFIKSTDMKLQIIDTPGPNNANNEEHMRTTYEKINNNSNNLIIYIYILNGTQLSTNDDNKFLKYVSEQIKKGGKQARDRFIFVINKMDLFNSEKENIEKVINNAKIYLNKFGIENPQVFPCSAYTALNIRTALKNVDIKSLTRNEERKLSSDARDTLPAIYKFNDYEDMHLEKYATLPPSIKRELNYKLEKAKKEENEKEQALIHCGIYSIEAIINTYVNKYAKTKQIKDLVETFEEILESNQIIAKVKKQIADNEEVAKEIKKRIKEINEKISNGKEAKNFKEKIDRWNPIDNIKKEIENLKNKTLKLIEPIFNYYEDYITNNEEEKILVKLFRNLSSFLLTNFYDNIECLIDNGIVKFANQILEEYKTKIIKIDNSAASMKLNFSTVDMIRGFLSNIKAEIEKEQNYKDLFNYKTITKAKSINITNDIFRIKDGVLIKYNGNGAIVEIPYSVTEIGDSAFWRCENLINIKIPNSVTKIGNCAFSWCKNLTYIEIPNSVIEIGDSAFWRCENLINIKIPNSVTKIGDFTFSYCKNLTDIIIPDSVNKIGESAFSYCENLTIHCIKDSVAYNIAKRDKIPIKLINPIRKSLDESINYSIYYAEKQIEDIKKQFKDNFDKLDSIIKEQYDELTKYANEEKENEKKYKDNQKVLDWIEYSIKEINDIIDI